MRSSSCVCVCCNADGAKGGGMGGDQLKEEVLGGQVFTQTDATGTYM